MPFEATESDGILTLTLDTPGSAVNILNRATAVQLTGLMAALDPARTRAVVFRTAKRSSFINGVGLLLAHAARTDADVIAAAQPARAAYRAVRESKVPTVAAIEGSCWGCGVEFALQCDYRIASDADNTELYMTEVNDYLFLPLFGSTWNLPGVVGLERAIDLLLFGEHWSGKRAKETGLVDAVVPSAAIGARSIALAHEVAGRPRPVRRAGFGPAEEAIVRATRARLDALPPAYRGIYDGALDLLVRGARRETTPDEHMDRELAGSAASAVADLGKAAFGLFYLRQMAAELSGSARIDAATRLDVSGEPRTPLLSEIARGSYVAREQGEERRVEVCDATSAPRPGVVAVLGGVANGVAGDAGGAPAIGGWDVTAYAPAWEAGIRFAELRAAGAKGRPLARAFAAHLGRAHVHVVLSRGAGDFASNRLLRAFLVPILAFVRRGGDGESVDLTLRDAGFTRRPRGWADALGEGALAVILGASAEDACALLAALSEASRTAGAPSPRLWAAIALSLLGELAESAAGFDHAVMADVAARELLGFPLGKTSLASYLKTAEVASLLEVADAALIGPDVIARARAFVARGKEFYR
jgi:enoyl-CoA hydratase/carnithine racemase